MKRIVLILLLGLILFACSKAPKDITGPVQQTMSIDSLLGVIDTLQIQIGRQRCIIRCLQDTLDSMDMQYRCKCGV